MAATSSRLGIAVASGQGMMMLGYMVSQSQGQGDALLAGVATRLQALGWPLAGAVQMNVTFDPARPCHMDLHVLSGANVVRISQDLGAGATGCRLDAQSLEQAVGLVGAALRAGPRLLILNKFGKQEADGRGFRPLIGEALQIGVPVLTSVSGANRAGFEAFAGGIGVEVAADPEALMAWCAGLVG